MPGTLYLVGTPIGNLGDMTPRAVETLRSVDFIAAEDTRVTAKLLHHFGVARPMVSCREQNERRRAQEIVARIAAGESCAVVTDAGMPCISDPGELLVALCVEQGVDVRVVPAASAAISALALSGLATARFSFEGFLTTNRGKRLERLEEVRPLRSTLIFYEAPHKLRTTLDDLYGTLGDRRCALCRELTKLHEEVVRCTLSEAVALYRETEPRGEYVLVVEGNREPDAPADFGAAVDRVRTLAAAGASLSSAAKAVAAETGLQKGALYKAALAETGPDDQERP